MLNYFKQDFLLNLSALVGFYFMLKSVKLRPLAIFCVLSIVLLEIIYYRVNPNMTRYSTHILPFLLIPAGYFFIKVPKNFMVYFALILISLLQIWFSFNGIKKWDGGDWTRQSYEEKSAINLRNYIKENDVMVVAFPEPYYYFNQKTVVGVMYEPPFIDLTGFDNNQDLIIINDMAMENIFPKFYGFLKYNLQDYKIGYYNVFTNYRYKTDYIKETSPVEVYRIKLWVLKDLIFEKSNP